MTMVMLLRWRAASAMAALLRHGQWCDGGASAGRGLLRLGRWNALTARHCEGGSTDAPSLQVSNSTCCFRVHRRCIRGQDDAMEHAGTMSSVGAATGAGAPLVLQWTPELRWCCNGRQRSTAAGKGVVVLRFLRRTGPTRSS